MSPPSPTGLLSDVTVLDVGRGISGPYCAKVLAGLGAEVIKVEPPEGDDARRMGPFPGDIPHQEKSGLFLALNADKRGVTLDLGSEDGAIGFRKLVESADIVVENHQPGDMEGWRLGYESLRKSNPALVMTSITPFGDWGPYAGYKATDLVLSHMSGHAHTHAGPVSDPDADPPVRAAGHQAELVAGLSAATATLMELYRRRVTGVGCHVVVSAYEAMVNQRFGGLVNHKERDPLMAAEATGSRKKQQAQVGPELPCSDGYIVASPRQDAQWDRWTEMMGSPEWSRDEKFATSEARLENKAELWDLQGEWTRRRSKREVARLAQESRVPCFPVNRVVDLLDEKQLAHRGFFVQVDHPVAGKLTYPGAAYRLSGAASAVGRRPAPMLGEHNRQILGSGG